MYMCVRTPEFVYVKVLLFVWMNYVCAGEEESSRGGGGVANYLQCLSNGFSANLWKVVKRDV